MKQTCRCKKKETSTKYIEQVKSINYPSETDLPTETSAEYMKLVMSVNIYTPIETDLPINRNKHTIYIEQVKSINRPNKTGLQA